MSDAKHYAARLLLVRHGQTDWNVAGRYQGRTDIPLNEMGREQSISVAKQLQEQPIAAVYSSALARAYETARIIAAPHGLEVIQDERLNEINQGEWEGLRFEEIIDRYPALYQRWISDPVNTHLPGGESVVELQARVLAAIEEIITKHHQQLICIVAHKVTNTVIKCHYLRLPLAPALRLPTTNAFWEEIAVDWDRPSIP
ncbi:MAG: alpha-ribazole phosphatase [Chloroflexi bacterium]|nr:alpha-ribazole phosphatase [Chloroflexota bacterium]MCL5074752.1 alpha-ribazole phosphatase [Chloroflexota bacterium]